MSDVGGNVFRVYTAMRRDPSCDLIRLSTEVASMTKVDPLEGRILRHARALVALKNKIR